MNSQQLFGEGVRRTKGKEATRYNLLAAKLTAEIVSNCLGPRGLEKMFTDILGEVTITKDGSTILRKIDVDHPAAKVLIEASNAVDNEVGDGTTSVVVLAGALIKKIEELLDMGIFPATIIDGYTRSMEIALEALNDLSQTCDNTDTDIMLKLATTCVQSKLLSYGEDHIARLIVDAISTIADYSNYAIEPDDIKIEEKPGNISNTELIQGIIIDKTIDSHSMPKMIKNAKIMLIDDELEGKRTRREAEIQMTSPNDIQSYKQQENQIIKSKIQHIIDSGANVVISRKGINTFAQHILTQAGIISVRRVKENDLIWIAKATGASISEKLSHEYNDYNDKHNHDHYSDDDDHHHGSNHEQGNNHHGHNNKDLHYHHGDIDIKLGYAERVYEKFVGDDKMIFIEGCRNPKAVTLLLRSTSKETLDECHRSALDAINVLKDFIIKPTIVTGGGSTEMAIARKIKQKASEADNRKHIVLQKFAEALEEIPLTIARNAGMDIIDTLVQLRSKHSKDDADAMFYGVNAIERTVDVMFPSIIEPSLVKEQVIKTAVEVTNMLVRVDDVLMAKPTMFTHTHTDGTKHSHAGGDKIHEHDYFDKLGKQQRPMHHYY
ncbi:MAG TPA: TCP-1/cpn60 chaperonin family protein [Nitrososphaera sp.]|nr:TCP-1/cpn60 chaperonin family protein [Nitrososphaera sp.]